MQFTTSHANGCVVIGYGRRDLNLRLNFGAGDFMYAIGESDEEPEPPTQPIADFGYY